MSARRRGLYWTGVALAVAAVVAGGFVAWRGFTQSASASSAVRSYFAALQRSDAAAALGYGTVPDGPHSLLTHDVLAAQQAIAPISAVRVLSSHTRNGTGSVSVDYTIAFPNAPQLVHDTIAVVRRGGAWRLARAAVATSLVMTTASDRATVNGKAVPDGSVVMFPGALPIVFDSPYLQLDPTQDYVSFGTDNVESVGVKVSPAGRAAVTSAFQSMLQSCLTSSHPDPRCPLPDDRYVPGSVRGQLRGRFADNLSIDLRSGSAGLLAISDTVQVTATYRHLTFANISVAGSGGVQLSMLANAYAVRPLRLTWAQT